MKNTAPIDCFVKKIALIIKLENIISFSLLVNISFVYINRKNRNTKNVLYDGQKNDNNKGINIKVLLPIILYDIATIIIKIIELDI